MKFSCYLKIAYIKPFKISSQGRLEMYAKAVFYQLKMHINPYDDEKFEIKKICLHKYSLK